jgi:hypothetical protein
MGIADRLNAELHRQIIGDRPIPDDEAPQFTGIDGLLDAGPAHRDANAEASAHLGDLLYEWARDWLDEQSRKVCPGRTCLLRGMEHEHTGRVRRDGR